MGCFIFVVVSVYFMVFSGVYKCFFGVRGRLVWKGLFFNTFFGVF